MSKIGTYVLTLMEADPEYTLPGYEASFQDDDPEWVQELLTPTNEPA